jgi:ribonuclease-3
LATKLKTLLGKEFLDSSHFNLAMTHRSASSKHNERMEFLGDSILGVIISEALYQQMPGASEGYLSRLRASLVNEDVLSEIGAELQLGDHLKLGSGELKSGGFRRKSTLADAFEALIASVYLERGIEASKDFVLQMFRSRLKNLPEEDELKDPKSRLQEFLQSRGLDLPEYSLISTTGDAHRQTFTTECKIESLKIKTEGVATSRRKAEQLSAASAYKQVTSK